MPAEIPYRERARGDGRLGHATIKIGGRTGPIAEGKGRGDLGLEAELGVALPESDLRFPAAPDRSPAPQLPVF